MTNKQKLAIKEAKQKLELLVYNSDYEVAHANADDILCSILIELGLQDVVDVYKEIGKWYS